MFSENLLRVQKETNDNRFEMNKADTPLVFFCYTKSKSVRYEFPANFRPTQQKSIRRWFAHTQKQIITAEFKVSSSQSVVWMGM